MPVTSINPARPCPKRVLITGIAGSGGSYLAEYILGFHPRVEVHGIVRWHSTANRSNIKSIESRVRIHECDLMDISSIHRTLVRSSPDVIFHLASHANVRTAFDTPIAVIHNNVMGTTNLFESIRMLEMTPVILLCSTSEVYGQISKDDVPIKETTPFRPVSPYAASKAAQDMIAQSYFRSFGFKIILTRMFTYLNPRRRDLFSSAFAYQVARIERGVQSVLNHGNLDSVRTLVDVRDAMRAYWLAAQFGDFGEAYNIGGQFTISVKDFLEMLIGMSSVEIPTSQVESLLRPSDVTMQIPDVRKFRGVTGWVPKYPIEESIRYLLNYFRGVVDLEMSSQPVLV